MSQYTVAPPKSWGQKHSVSIPGPTQSVVRTNSMRAWYSTAISLCLLIPKFKFSPALSVWCLANPLEPIEQTKQQEKKNLTNKPSPACYSQARPPHWGGGESGTKQKPRGAKSGCKDKKGVQRQRGRFLGVVLCPHRHGTSPRGINMQQLLARERVCSSVFSPFPPPLLVTVAFSFISSHRWRSHWSSLIIFLCQSWKKGECWMMRMAGIGLSLYYLKWKGV